MPIGTVSKGRKKVAEGKWVKIKGENKFVQVKSEPKEISINELSNLYNKLSEIYEDDKNKVEDEIISHIEKNNIKFLFNDDFSDDHYWKDLSKDLISKHNINNLNYNDIKDIYQRNSKEIGNSDIYVISNNINKRISEYVNSKKEEEENIIKQYEKSEKIINDFISSMEKIKNENIEFYENKAKTTESKYYEFINHDNNDKIIVRFSTHLPTEKAIIEKDEKYDEVIYIIDPFDDNRNNYEIRQFENMTGITPFNVNEGIEELQNRLEFYDMVKS
jgi:hypothetical protein